MTIYVCDIFKLICIILCEDLLVHRYMKNMIKDEKQFQKEEKMTDVLVIK